jgi:ketosteroid isomerase-like protein
MVELVGDARLDEYIEAWLVHPSAGAAQGGPELQRLLALMARDVRYEDVPSGAVFSGHDGIRDMCAAAYAWSRDVTMKVVSSQTDGHLFAIEVLASGTSSSGAGEASAPGRAFSFPMASIGTFDAEGMVARHRDYWDLAAFQRQIGS